MQPSKPEVILSCNSQFRIWPQTMRCLIKNPICLISRTIRWRLELSIRISVCNCGALFILTYQLNTLRMNIIISFNRSFACIISCIFAMHFIEMEVRNLVILPMISTLIHPCIRRRVQGFQNVVRNFFPSHFQVGIAPTMTSNGKTLQPSIQLNLTKPPRAISPRFDITTRNSYKKLNYIKTQKMTL